MVTATSWFESGSLILLAQQGGQGSILTMMMPILLIGMLFYVLMILPEKKKRNEIARMQEGLKKNDRVVTIGGILGVVVNVQSGSEKVTVRIDEANNTRIEVLRGSISRVLSDDKSDANKAES
ncbi:MAG: preprotein translocase subunit YajC [Planctomycetaceae bacterium]|nr:MAG: preprotein translocase subunit YajC [Planctomycetaceae bacterium]